MEPEVSFESRNYPPFMKPKVSFEPRNYPPFMKPEVSFESRNYPPFMEPEVSLPCSLQPAAGPYPEPDACSSHPLTLCPYYPF
jgi:hypothetical protein